MLSAKIRTKWIIGRPKWIIEYFSYLALVEYRTKWIRIKWGPGVHTFRIHSMYVVLYISRFVFKCKNTTRRQSFANKRCFSVLMAWYSFEFYNKFTITYVVSQIYKNLNSRNYENIFLFWYSWNSELVKSCHEQLKNYASF